jgi:GNAT superfamily N-acetyltransferase
MPNHQNVNFSITRNEISDADWKLTRVIEPGEFFQFHVFCCGDDDLNEFIKEDALAHKDELMAETYVLKQVMGEAPVAFVSFCNDSIPLTQLQGKSKRAIPNKKRFYPTMPAVKIARLGVRSDLHGKNIGTLIINMSKRFFTTENRTGCRFITVDAYNKEEVISFYGKNDFIPLKEQKNPNTIIMYLDLKRLSV